MSFHVEDSTTAQVPALVEALVSQIITECKSCDANYFMFVLILTMMIENGFVPLSNDGDLLDPLNLDIKKHINYWQSHKRLEIIFCMNGFNSVTLKLIGTPLGAAMIVNLVMWELNSETYTVCLPVNHFVVSPQASSIPMIFSNLKHLSETFKNKIVSAVKSRILSYHGYASASLIGIPEEILLNIALFLPIKDIVSLGKTCKRLNCIVDKELLWHSLYKRDFGRAEVGNSSWKLLYKEQYENSLQVHRRAGAMHDYMDYSDYVSYIDHPYWGVML